MRVPGGATLAWVWGVLDVALSHLRPFILSAHSRGPLPTGCGCGGCGRVNRSSTPQRALLRAAFARCGGSTRAPGGGASCLGVGRPGTGARPPPTSRPFRRVAEACFQLPWVRGVRSQGPVTNPTARALASCLCALWGRHEGAPGGRPLPGCGASGVVRSPTPVLSSFQARSRGPLPTGCGCGGCGCGDPSPTPQRALLRAAFARCGGGTRAPGWGASCLGVGRPGTGAHPPLTSRPFGRAARARFAHAVGAKCGRGGPAVLGTFSCAAVRHVLCALPGFAANGGRWGLAPVRVPSLWLAACLSDVPRGSRWCAAPRPVQSLSVLRSAFPDAVLPFPAGERGGRPRTRLFVTAAAPPSASYQFRGLRWGCRSWAACAAVVCGCGPGH